MKQCTHSACFILVLFLSLPGLALANKWTREKSKDGAAEVQSQVQEITIQGKTVDVVEYLASTQTKVKKQKFLAAMMSASNHKVVLQNKQSRLLDSVSETEWIIYYLFDFPWPMSDADCVVIMRLEEEENQVTFKLRAAPDRYPMQDVDRMTLYDVEYSLQETDDSTSTISIYSKIASSMDAPDFLVNMWFPEGPADLLKRVIAVSQ